MYIRIPETGQSGRLSFSEAEFQNVLNCSRLIGEVGMRIFDEETGIMEYYLVGSENIGVIH